MCIYCLLVANTVSGNFSDMSCLKLKKSEGFSNIQRSHPVRESNQRTWQELQLWRCSDPVTYSIDNLALVKLVQIHLSSPLASSIASTWKMFDYCFLYPSLNMSQWRNNEFYSLSQQWSYCYTWFIRVPLLPNIIILLTWRTKHMTGRIKIMYIIST